MERGKFREWVCYNDERKRIFDEIIAEVIRLERERCIKIIENSKCECQESGVRPHGCYDYACSEAWILKKISEGV